MFTPVSIPQTLCVYCHALLIGVWNFVEFLRYLFLNRNEFLLDVDNGGGIGYKPAVDPVDKEPGYDLSMYLLRWAVNMFLKLGSSWIDQAKPFSYPEKQLIGSPNGFIPAGVHKNSKFVA